MPEFQDDKDFLFNAIQRLRFKHKWTKEELCRHLDVNMADLHKYLNGQEKPPEALMLIVRTELEAGGREHRVKLRTGELVDRMIEIDHRLGEIEAKMDRLLDLMSSSKATQE